MVRAARERRCAREVRRAARLLARPRRVAELPRRQAAVPCAHGRRFRCRSADDAGRAGGGRRRPRSPRGSSGAGATRRRTAGAEAAPAAPAAAGGDNPADAQAMVVGGGKRWGEADTLRQMVPAGQGRAVGRRRARPEQESERRRRVGARGRARGARAAAAGGGSGRRSCRVDPVGPAVADREALKAGTLAAATCFRCGRDGHLSRDCPYAGGGAYVALAGAAAGGDAAPDEAERSSRALTRSLPRPPRGEADPNRSPSPPPTYDAVGKRTNTREVRMRQALEREKEALVDRIVELRPAPRARSACSPRSP